MALDGVECYWTVPGCFNAGRCNVVLDFATCCLASCSGVALGYLLIFWGVVSLC